MRGIRHQDATNFPRLCCEDVADKTVVLLNLSCMRLENTSLSSTHGGSARSHVRDTVNGRPCRLQHADAPINSVQQLSIMTWRNTILEKIQRKVVLTRKSVVFIHPSSSRGTPMRVFFVPILRFTRILCLEAISSGPRKMIPDFVRPANKDSR